jgi:Tfp pilus assembly protein PilF
MPSIEYTKRRSWSRKRRRFWYWTIGILVVGIAGGIVVWPRAVNRYNRWNANRYARKAAASFAQGDIRHAILNARIALEKNPVDIEATRAMAKALGAMGMPEAEQWRARLDSLQPGDAENVLALAQAALKGARVAEAERFVDSLGPEARDSAAFHAVTAAIAMTKRDTASAESHWMEAARLEPGEISHRLRLAALRLESPAKGVREAALAELEEMRGKPDASVEALRLLLADALGHREAARARETADALVADARCTFNDRLKRVAALRAIRDDRSGPYLLELRDAAVNEPAKLYALLTWMNGSDLSLMVSEWTRSLPEEVISKPPVCTAVAEALSKAGDWQKLQSVTAATTWGDTDYLRRAFLARALEHLGDDEGEATQWAEACSAARSRSDAGVRMEQLARFAIQCKWDKRAEELMWTITTLPQCPRWVVDALWKLSFQRGETPQLQKLAGLLAKLDPKGVATRNNYAFLSLLIRTDEGNPHRLAENLHRENPGNALIASTFGLSLYQQGKPEEAAALMSRMKPEELHQPQVALYYAIFLIAAGERDKAEEYLKLSEGSPMLPEEKALLDRVKAAGSKAGEPQSPASPVQNAPSPSGAKNP